MKGGSLERNSCNSCHSKLAGSLVRCIPLLFSMDVNPWLLAQSSRALKVFERILYPLLCRKPKRSGYSFMTCILYSYMLSMGDQQPGFYLMAIEQWSGLDAWQPSSLRLPLHQKSVGNKFTRTLRCDAMEAFQTIIQLYKAYMVCIRPHPCFTT